LTSIFSVRTVLIGLTFSLVDLSVCLFFSQFVCPFVSFPFILPVLLSVLLSSCLSFCLFSIICLSFFSVCLNFFLLTRLLFFYQFVCPFVCPFPSLFEFSSLCIFSVLRSVCLSFCRCFLSLSVLS
jgi:hypothetical protein